MTTQQKCLLNCKLCNLETFINEEWHNPLKEEFNKKYFLKIKEFLHTSEFYPPLNSIFKFTFSFHFTQTKVVILGQDPYHNKGQATGIAFSVPRSFPIPPSLVNIYNEISNSFNDFLKPKHGDLSKWSEQNVLLLNTSLTVKPNTPSSHSKIGWEIFTNKILQLINDKCNNVVFMLWGNHAISKKGMIDSSKHLILCTTHPSPFSARKGFLGCNHFKLANEYLIKNNIEPINWNL